jgi:hypothetical protein
MSLQIFTTISTRGELYNYTTIQNERVLAAIGLTTAWDIPTEIWTYDSSSMAVDDGVKVIRPTDIPASNPGRFLFRNYFVRQFGTLYSKEFNSSLTVSGSAATFDISSAAFTSLVSVQATALLASGTVFNLPIASISAQSLTSVTISLLESKTTNTLLISSTEGLEAHLAAGTVVYLTVKGN